jgi:hypothetical protein
MTTLETVFGICALVGGVLFGIRLVLQLVGMGADHVDIAVSHDPAGGDSDASFKIISLQGVTAFLLMFGLVGWVMLHNGLGVGWSIAGATGAGTVMMLLIAWIYRTFMRFQSSGTLDLTNAVGAEGTVYLRIPAGGTGKIQVTVQGRLLTLDAVSDAKEEIKSGGRVKVESVVAGEVLKVVKS